MLKIAEQLSLPLDAITQTFGILAVRGAGKSNTAAVMAEAMFRNHLPFVVVDPVGAWWGLRSSADGKGPGLSLAIFGGRHGDVPLEKNSGQMIADLIVEHRLSCVLDLSEFGENEKRRFLYEFAERLYRKNQDPLHMFLEEADDYAPQRGATGDIARVLGAFESIVRRGRARGLGITMITQRSAVLNKNVLTQIETLIVLRTTAPNDRKAIEAWVEYHGQGKDLVQSLPELAAGEAWVWSPSWLKILKRVKINRRSTFDSGATPRDIAGKRPAANLADVDLGQIRERMQETIERAKAEDPRELRTRIRELERRLREQPKAETKTVEVPVLDKQALARLDKLRESIENYATVFRSHGNKAHDVALELSQLSQQLGAIAATVVGLGLDLPRASSPAAKPQVRAPRRQSVAHSNGNHGDLDGVRLRVLRAVQSLRDRNLPINRVSVARWMGIHPNGGRYNAALRQLKEADLLDADLHPTEKTPAVSPLCADGPAGVLDLLDQGKKRVLEEILQHGGVTREELADKLGIHPNGGRFNSHLRWLRDMGVVTDRGPIKAVEGVYR